jgi:hypothetical protein
MSVRRLTHWEATHVLQRLWGKVSRRRFKQMCDAAKKHGELIAAGLGRRDLFKMGLLTAGGMLIAKMA